MVDLAERGLRNPRHGFAVVTQSRLLQPVFAAPVRPMETVVGWRAQFNAMTTSMLRMPWLPSIFCEFGVWKVPVSTLGDYFTDMFVADFEDEADALIDTVVGTGIPHAGTPVSSQGPRSQSALHTRTRHWAGEYGDPTNAATFDTAKAFTPYVSAATYHVARSFYEMELELGNSSPSAIGGFTRIDDDLWQIPPVISEHYRSMTGTMMGGASGSNVMPLSSVAEWAERLSLLSRPNRTYREYLQGFGVPDSRIATLPEPLMMVRRMLRPMDAKLIGNVVSVGSDQSGVEARWDPSGRWASNQTEVGSTFSMGGDQNLSAYRVMIDETRKRRLMIDEPSIILGCVMFQMMNTRQTNFAHHMDVTRLISGSLWGDQNADEMDFITAQDVTGTSSMSDIPGRPQSPEAINSGQNEDGVGPPYVMNALNLYLNGDVFCNDTQAFGPYGPGGVLQQQVTPLQTPSAYQSEVLGELQFTAVGEYAMGVATDLVS